MLNRKLIYKIQVNPGKRNEFLDLPVFLLKETNYDRKGIIC